MSDVRFGSFQPQRLAPGTCGAGVVAEDDEVVEFAVTVADMVLEQRLATEPEALEQPIEPA